MPDKPKLALYWAASCGGCEIAVVNLHEKILDVDAAVDLMFCPCLLDTKKKDIEALPDGAIAVTLFNGALRTEENIEMAHLLRRKSQLMVAFGSCAKGGCIPALANFTTRDALFDTVYLDNPSTENPAGVIPGGTTTFPEGDIHLPAFLDRVQHLAQQVTVDYYVPGCPPESHQIWNVIETILSGELPPAGSTIGCGALTVCDDCDRTKEEKRISAFRRNYEFYPERETCLLEQGLLCLGIATRSGCGAPCTKANMPCSGCYGAPDGVSDQGAKMVAALGSVMDIGDTAGLSEEAIAARVDAFLSAIPDYAGLFYKYTLASSTLGGRVGRQG
ncbi:MAG TPA: NADH:ubiquinone oxidoreductase [Desulfuromonadales bacterium]|nr:NADH:ubiquinone oxidoreductase [Desulfuromonadales bacterium]